MDTGTLIGIIAGSVAGSVALLGCGAAGLRALSARDATSGTRSAVTRSVPVATSVPVTSSVPVRMPTVSI
jgi:hypothetical protein